MTISDQLGDRALPKDLPGLIEYMTRRLVPLVKQIRAWLNRWLSPGTFAYGANVTLGLTTHMDWACSTEVSGDMVVTLEHGTDDVQGTVMYLQDLTGHAVTYVAVGRTTYYFGTMAVATERGADAFLFVTVAGVAELWIFSAAV